MSKDVERESMKEKIKQIVDDRVLCSIWELRGYSYDEWLLYGEAGWVPEVNQEGEKNNERSL
jgi:hypothetical protein